MSGLAGIADYFHCLMLMTKDEGDYELYTNKLIRAMRTRFDAEEEEEGGEKTQISHK